MNGREALLKFNDFDPSLYSPYLIPPVISPTIVNTNNTATVVVPITTTPSKETQIPLQANHLKSNISLINNNEVDKEDHEERIEIELMKNIENIKNYVYESQISLSEKESIISFLPVYLNIYCSRGENFNHKFVKPQFEKLGLNFLNVTILFMILERVRKELI